MTTTELATLDDRDAKRLPMRSADLAGFDGSAAGVGQIELQAGTAGAIAREEAEMKAAIVLARTMPRNEASSYNKLIGACRRPSFAESAEYRFPRGKEEISGPSVDLAREAARCWGNIRYGFRVVTEDDDRVHIMGYAMDLESGLAVGAEDKFAKLIQRNQWVDGQKRTAWIKPDERDLRELVNRRAAFLVRNAILGVIPPDVIDDARNEAQATLKKAAAGEIAEDPAKAVRRLTLAFGQVSVSVEMLEARLGHPLATIDADELAGLRGVYKSIRDGQAKREEFFDLGGSPSKPTGEKVEKLNSRVAATKADRKPATEGNAEPINPAVAREQIRAACTDWCKRKGETVTTDECDAAAASVAKLMGFGDSLDDILTGQKAATFVAAATSSAIDWSKHLPELK